MPQEAIGKVWQYAITGMYENSPRGEPKPGAIKIHNAFKELVKKGEMSGPAPSERAIGRYLAKVRDMTPEERSLFRVVRWPWTYLDGELPWEAAPLVLETARSYHPNRVLVRNAWWTWRIHESKPEVDWQKCWRVGSIMAAWEAAPEQNAHIPKAVEEWLLLGRSLDALNWTTGRSPAEIAHDSPWAAFEALAGRVITREEVGR
jgi:hypothetical protein